MERAAATHRGEVRASSEREAARVQRPPLSLHLQLIIVTQRLTKKIVLTFVMELQVFEHKGKVNEMKSKLIMTYACMTLFHICTSQCLPSAVTRSRCFVR